MARLLFDVATQLENFEMDIGIHLPFQGLNPDDEIVNTDTKIKIGEAGALILLGATMDPALRLSLVDNIPVIEYLDNIPIIGPLFKLAVLEIKMDPVSRRIKAGVRYFGIPFPIDVHERVLRLIDENGFLADEVVDRLHSSIREKLPLYTWEMLDLALQSQQQRGPNDATTSGDTTSGATTGESLLRSVQPLWSEGRIEVKGNFSNKTFSALGMTIDFAPLKPPHQHRLIIEGPLTSPTVTLTGFQRFYVQTRENRLSLINEDPQMEPLKFTIEWDPQLKQFHSLHLPSFQSRHLRIIGEFAEPVRLAPVSTGQNRRLEFNLKDGIAVKNLRFYPEPKGYALRVESFSARSFDLHGMGIELATKVGSLATLEQIGLFFRGEQIHFNAKLRGQASGLIRYFMNDAETGQLSFELLREAIGDILVGPDQAGKTRVVIDGAFEALLPDLRLVVNSPSFHGSTITEVTNAHIEGRGTLTVFPDDSRVLIESVGKQNFFRVRGSQGRVQFNQNLSEVPQWKEDLAVLFGERVGEVTTNIDLQVQKINFGVQSFDLESVLDPDTKKPSFLIEKATMGPINVEGQLVKGHLFLRLPNGLFFPLDLNHHRRQDRRHHKPKTAPEISLSLEFLQDSRASGFREIEFKDIALIIQDTDEIFPKAMQTKCGAKGVHIHTTLAQMMFWPQKRDYEMEGLGDAHLILKNPFGKGCLVVE